MKVILDRGAAILLWEFESRRPLLIKEVRDWLGWSQSYLADQAKVSQTTISRIEKGGKYAVREETAAKIATALGLKVSQIDLPMGLSRQGRYPGQGGSKSSPLWQSAYCLKCFTAHSLSSNHGDKMCETYS